MTDHDDRLRERLRTLDSVQPSPGLIDRPRTSPPQRGPAGPSRARRVVVMVTAFAVFGASAILVWRAFDPMGTRGTAATPTTQDTRSPAGTTVYVNQVGLPISVSYPAGWLAQSIVHHADAVGPDQLGVVVANTSMGMPSDAASPTPGPLPENPDLPPDYVRLTILTNGDGQPVAGAVDSPLPLSMSDAKVPPGPFNIHILSATLAGVRFAITVQGGPQASAADLAAADGIVASILPTASGTPPPTTATPDPPMLEQPPGWVIEQAIKMAIRNKDPNPTSAYWLLADPATIAPVVGLSPDQSSGPGQEYLVVLHGSFTARGAKIPTGTAVPTGSVLTFTLDPKSHQVLDWGVGHQVVDIPGLRPFIFRPASPAAGTLKNMCDIQQSRSVGDVNGDGSLDAVAIGTLRSPHGACSRSAGATRLLTVDLGNDGSVDVRSTAMDCTTWCVPFAVTDVGGDGRAEILVNEGHLAAPVTAIVGVYELTAGRLVPVNFPNGSNQFGLSDSWQGYAGAFCRSPGAFTTWVGDTNGGGTLRTVTYWTFQIDPATLTFTLVSKQGPSPTSKVPARAGWHYLCGVAVPLG